MPRYFFAHAALAAAYGQLGQKEAAAAAVAELHALKPGIDMEREYAKWFDAPLVAQLMDGLRKAGIPLDGSTAAATDSGTDDGFWVSVQPFKSRGATVDLAALADGLSEEIVTGLSRFSYLRVIGTAAGGDGVRARYVIEGSVRQEGSQLRVAVQLVDATTGAHLWAETYDRPFRADSVFALQDELVPRIVSTVADLYGVLPQTMCAALRGKPADQLTPYEAVLAKHRVRRAPHARSARDRARDTRTRRRTGPGFRRCLGHAGDHVFRGARRRIQRPARSAWTRLARRTASARGGAVERVCALRAGAGAILSQGIPGLPAVRRSRHRAQSHGRSDHRLRRSADRVCRRLGARLRRGRTCGAAQPASSRVVLVSVLLQRVPQRRLPRRAGHRAQDQPAGLLLYAPRDRGRVRTARGSRRCERSPARVARAEAGHCPRRARARWGRGTRRISSNI